MVDLLAYVVWCILLFIEYNDNADNEHKTIKETNLKQ